MSVHLSVAFKVLNLQMSDGAQGDGHTDDTKLHGKPDKTLRFSLCSDNLEGISEGWSAAASHVTHNMMQPSMGKAMGKTQNPLIEFILKCIFSFRAI